MSYHSDALARHGPAMPIPLQGGVDPYIARIYSNLLAALAIMALTGWITHHLAPPGWLRPLALADGFLWVACGWFGWRRPMGLVFPAFVLVTGALLGLLASEAPETFALASWLTLATFAGLTAFVWISRIDFSFLVGFLCVSFFLMLAGSFARFLIAAPWFHIGWTALGVLTFACWVLYDTGNIVRRADGAQDEQIAAFELFLDIVGFHRWLLEHLRLLDLFGWKWKFWERD